MRGNIKFEEIEPLNSEIIYQPRSEFIAGEQFHNS